MDSDLIKEFIEFIRSRWNRKSTLLILLLFLSFVLLWGFSGIKIEEIEGGEYWISGIILFSTVVFWMYSNRTPKAPKGKIGFAVGIYTDDPAEQQKIKRDFTQTLKKLLHESNFKYSFTFIELPNHIVEKIDSPQTAIQMLRETKCSFMIYGKARTTTIKGQMQHVLDLEGAVLHGPIPVEISRSFSKEFADLFPKRKTISSEGDLFEFEITAKWLDIVSKYVIGIAALLSGDVEYSQQLFEYLQNELNAQQIDLPAIVKIRNRLPSRLKDVYVLQATLLYASWTRSKNPELLMQLKIFLDKLKVLSPENYEACELRSIWYFLTARDIKSAKNEIIRNKAKTYNTWRYNHAFLLAYEGNLQEAFREYLLALKNILPNPKTIFDIVEFIMWVVEVEPNKVQLHFCMGLINYFGVVDYSLALQDFEKFLDLTQPDEFVPQRKQAKKYVEELIKKQIIEI